MTDILWRGRNNIFVPQQRFRVSTVKTVESRHQPVAPRRRPEWRNRLILGDVTNVLSALIADLGQVAQKVNLIYVDPPFGPGSPHKWAGVPRPGTDHDTYLAWFHPIAVQLRTLLADTGTIYVHLDWHVAHYAKVVMDEVFGVKRFVNEVVWKRQTSSGYKGKSAFGRNHDTLLVYSKTSSYTFHPTFLPYSEKYLRTHYNKFDQQGRTYRSHWVGPNTKAETIRNGLATDPPKYFMRANGTYGKRVYPRGVAVDDVWTDIKALTHAGKERVAYQTQKPEALLRRILESSSNEGDLVLDCFCGSGTTAIVAEKMGRRWIASDVNKDAMRATQQRLSAVGPIASYAIQRVVPKSRG